MATSFSQAAEALRSQAAGTLPVVIRTKDPVMMQRHPAEASWLGRVGVAETQRRTGVLGLR